MQKVHISQVGCDAQTGKAVILLNEPEGTRVLPIWIGLAEAKAITLALQEIQTSRPLTHELLFNVITQTQHAIEKVEIYELKDNAFIARIILRKVTEETKPQEQFEPVSASSEHTTLAIDARPSDAIAVAIMASAPIYVAGEVLEQAAIPASSIQKDEQEDTEFKSFVQDLKASDFKLPGH